MCKIRKLAANETPPYHLLLLADPFRPQIETYLKDGHCFVLVMDSRIVGVVVLQQIGETAYEIMNVAVDEAHQGQGLGKALIRFAIAQAKWLGASVLNICTGNSSLVQLALYQRCGFRMVGIEQNYFIDNYPEPIFENGIQCTDRVRLQLKLND